MTGSTVADALVELAHDRFEFHRGADGNAYATWSEYESKWQMGQRIHRRSRKPTHIAYDLQGPLSLRALLAAAYYEQHQRTANPGAIASAMLAIQGSTLEMEVEPTALRVDVREDTADDDTPTQCRFLDLGRDDGRLVVLRGGGWTIEDAPGDVWDPYVHFTRTKLTAEMPLPTPGGSVDLLWPHLNIPEADRPLVLAWMVAALIAEIPHPVLVLEGEAGTAKTAMARRLIDLIDPQIPPVRKPPRDVENWIVAASGSWAVAIDNVSTISADFSDSLCRASTGDGDVRRALYTDGGLATFAFRRVVILTTIGTDAAYRGDLAERMLLCQLATIEPDSRRTERELDAEWERDKPAILGGLLDVAAKALQVLPDVNVRERTRMADFLEVIAAVDQVTGSEGLDRYRRQTNSLAASTLSGNPFISALATTWLDGEYTVAEILKEAAPAEGTPPGWPSDSRAAAVALRRNGAALRSLGWTITDTETRRNNSAVWRVKAPFEPFDQPGGLLSATSGRG